MWKELSKPFSGLGKLFTKSILPDFEKVMPEQPGSIWRESHEINHWDTDNLYAAYEIFECVNRGINLIADCASTIPIDVGKPYNGYVPVSKSRKMSDSRLHALLNIAPNPDQDRVEFFHGLVTDFLLSGNAYIYFDGAYLYRLPVCHMRVVAGTKKLVDKYLYNPNGVDIEFSPDEIIRIREGSATNPYIGKSRLASAIQSLAIIDKMNTYQRNYFKNNTILGVILLSKNILGNTTKQRLKSQLETYNPAAGANSPIILDGDVKLENISRQTNKELDYDTSLKTREGRVLQALGVPQILIDSGQINVTNIDQNLKLFYLTTILPIITRLISGMERYFGIDLKPALAEVPAMLPDAKERASALQSLVVAGIITRNEARAELRYGKANESFADELVLPANIAGSALDATQGGRPTQNANN